MRAPLSAETREGFGAFCFGGAVGDFSGQGGPARVADTHALALAGHRRSTDPEPERQFRGFCFFTPRPAPVACDMPLSLTPSRVFHLGLPPPLYIAVKTVGRRVKRHSQPVAKMFARVPSSSPLLLRGTHWRLFMPPNRWTNQLMTLDAYR